MIRRIRVFLLLVSDFFAIESNVQHAISRNHSSKWLLEHAVYSIRRISVYLKFSMKWVVFFLKEECLVYDKSVWYVLRGLWWTCFYCILQSCDWIKALTQLFILISSRQFNWDEKEEKIFMMKQIVFIYPCGENWVF